MDLAYSPAETVDWTLNVETMCLNRDLPQRLPFGGGRPRLEVVDGGPLASLQCLTMPKPTTVLQQLCLNKGGCGRRLSIRRKCCD